MIRTVFLMALLVVVVPFGFAKEENESFHGYPLLYEADFSEGLDNWELMDPDAWKIIEDDGKKVLASVKDSDYDPQVRSPQNIAVLKDLKVSDFVLVAKIKSTQPAYRDDGSYYYHRDMCVLFNWQDPSHYYYTHIGPAQNMDPHANSIFIVNGEPRKSIAYKRNEGTEWKDDVYHTVKVVRDTDTGEIDVYFDDMETPILRAKDTTFKSGRLGVGSFDDIGNIAEFKVYGKSIATDNE